MKQTFDNAINVFLEEGVTALAKKSKQKIQREAHKIGYNPEPIWDRDWDLLIILDACRLDLIKSVEDEFGFLGGGEVFTSSGSTTIEYLVNNFDDSYLSEMEDTAYITGNPNSVRAFPYHYPTSCECGEELNPSFDSIYHDGEVTCGCCGDTISGNRKVPVQILREVWRDKWENEIGTIRPRPITDAAIQTARTENVKRMIVHYMQPHHPFLSAPDLDKGSYIADGDEYRKKKSKNIWEKLEKNDLDRERVWEEYQNNLRIVLEDVELLTKNVDFDKPIITSDHGNALGEYGVYGHQGGMPLDCLVKVPWYETTVVDRENYDPSESLNINTDVNSEEIKERLSDLGYR